MAPSRDKNGPDAPLSNWSDTCPICFGLDRPTDERSLTAFLLRFTDRSLLKVLLPRMTDNDIEATVDLLSRILKRHLTHGEYHRLFLRQPEKDGE